MHGSFLAVFEGDYGCAERQPRESLSVFYLRCASVTDLISDYALILAGFTPESGE